MPGGKYRMPVPVTHAVVAAAIAFLAGEEASYITGQTLNVSGGLSMW